jgi:hypothetical protein
MLLSPLVSLLLRGALVLLARSLWRISSLLLATLTTLLGLLRRFVLLALIAHR